MEEELLTREDLLNKLRAYQENQDDDVIRVKEKVKNLLIKSPELLYALNDSKNSKELFDNEGNINYDGEWDVYFNDNIRPYVFFPETQEHVKNYICYKVDFTDTPQYNNNEKYCMVSFLIFCDSKDLIDKNTGITRHDLISSILREKIAWTNLFGTQCKISSDKESFTDSNYTMRTIVFQFTGFNSTVKTMNGNTRSIRYSGGK